jgi:GNAT superfamily N-acetyltransferase
MTRWATVEGPVARPTASRSSDRLDAERGKGSAGPAELPFQLRTPVRDEPTVARTTDNHHLPRTVSTMNTTPPLRIVHLGEDDWFLLRALRLRALATDPAAFGSTLAVEKTFDEATWRQRLRTSAWLAASTGMRPCGLMALAARSNNPSIGDVLAVWVAPESRGRGTGAALLDALIATAHQLGLHTLALFVVDGNLPAERLYSQHGFVRTGHTKPLPHTPEIVEVEMRLPLEPRHRPTSAPGLPG